MRRERQYRRDEIEAGRGVCRSDSKVSAPYASCCRPLVESFVGVRNRFHYSPMREFHRNLKFRNSRGCVKERSLMIGPVFLRSS